MNKLDVLKRKVGIKSKFLKGALIIGVGTILCKIIGAVYRIPLTNILGAEGMGIYQLVYPIFALILVVSSSGIPTAISKLIAEKISKNQYDYVEKIKIVSLYSMIIIGAVFCFAIISLSGVISSLQGNELSTLGYIVIAPSIFLVAIVSVLRGVFQGQEQMLPTAISQNIEQIGKLVFGLLLAIVLLPYGVLFGVAGALLGVTLSEVFCLIYLLSRSKKMKFSIPEQYDTYCPSGLEVFKELWSVALPITICSAVIPFSLVIDSMIIVNLLVGNGIALDLATSQYGIYSGVVNSVINMPIIVASSLAIVLVPSVCNSFASGDDITARKKMNQAFQISLFVSVPCFFIFLIFGYDIMRILFPVIMNGELANLTNLLLQISSINVVFLSFFYISTSLLQCLDKYWVPSINLMVCSVLKIVLIFILIGSIGIVAGAVAGVVSFGIALIINLVFLYKHQKITQLHSLFCIFFSGLSVLIILGLKNILPFMGVYAILPALLVGGIFYLLSVWWLFNKCKS